MKLVHVRGPDDERHRGVERLPPAAFSTCRLICPVSRPVTSTVCLCHAAGPPF